MSSILPTIQPRVLAIVSSVYQNGQVVPREMRTKEEVLLFQAELTHIQKQLRALKSEVQAEKKAVRRRIRRNVLPSHIRLSRCSAGRRTLFT